MHLRQSLPSARAALVKRPPAINGEWVSNLPGLPEFHAGLEAKIRAAEDSGAALALLILNIDSFAVLHQALGHRHSDALLLAVANSARLSLPADAVLGRVSDDAFAAILPGVSGAAAAVAAARKVQQNLVDMPPFELGDVTPWADHPSFVSVTCCAGISLAPSQGLSADRLLSQAKTALDQARAAGRSGAEVYSPEQAQALSERCMVMLGIPSALKQGELELRYQPQFCVRTDRLVGIEALLRWRHPRHGLVMPNRFIAAAETCGLIDDIGAWVLSEACAQARRWRGLGMPDLPIAVNVSAKQLLQANFPQQIEQALSDAGIAASQLSLEITESALLEHPTRAFASLARCRALGVRISLDDFGTGHANLKALLDMPIDQIKIDGSFIAEVTHSRRAAAVVNSIIQMARELELDVVAEGVETAAQLAFLRSVECSKLQGHLFAEALEPWVFEVQPWGLPQ